MKKIPLEHRIIFALDLENGKQAREWVKRLEGKIKFYKVGLQLFLADWFNTVDWILDRGHKVMLDLKFFDVPATVGLAIEQLQGRGLEFVTLHGNTGIIQRAAQAKSDCKLLAVTVLTSLNQDDLLEMGYAGKLEDLVSARTANALASGCDGVVCSPMEAGNLRSQYKDDFYIVTPGIRPAEQTKNLGEDQKRVLTAGQAIKNGADHLVVGRPIKKAKDPIKAVQSLQQEIIQVLEQS